MSSVNPPEYHSLPNQWNAFGELGPKAAQQAERILRQARPLKNFDHVIATDEGIDPSPMDRSK
jgi:hypothetical protein